MLKIDFDNPDKDVVIQEAKEYIHLLENTVTQLEEALKTECENYGTLYGEKLHLEDRVNELEEALNEKEI